MEFLLPGLVTGVSEIFAIQLDEVAWHGEGLGLNDGVDRTRLF